MSTFFVKKLREFMRGKITPYQLQDSDNSVIVRKYVPNMPAQSELVISFDDYDELLKAIGLREDDIHFYHNVKNPYYSGELLSSDSFEDDFLQGYGPWYHFNEENEEKIQKIAKIIFPGKLDLNDEDSKGEFARKLKNIFRRSFEDIVSDYSNERNNELRISAESHIDSEIENILDEFDFKLSGDGIKTTAVNLFGLYAKTGMLDAPPKKLIKYAIEDLDNQIGGWYENLYDMSTDTNFDQEGFNNEVSRTLDSLIDDVYDEDKNPNISEFLKVYERITKKFTLGKWYNLPKDKTKEVDFKISSLDPETNKVLVELRKGLKRKNLKLSEQNFYNLLYQPELFQFGELHDF